MGSFDLMFVSWTRITTHDMDVFIQHWTALNRILIWGNTILLLVPASPYGHLMTSR